MIASQPRFNGATLARKLCLAFSSALMVAGCHARATPPQVSAQLPAPGPTKHQDAKAGAARPSPIHTDRAASTTKVRSADVEKTVVGIFGDTATFMAPLIDAIATAGPTWDMDVRSYEGQERVAFYVNLFTQSSRNRFQEKLRLSTRYEPMIRAKLRAGGIPEDMMFLAMVESGFDPNAYSSAAAVGMWQFMSSTARDVGLRVDWWVDERRDPARSTDGAIRFLGDLQNQFGSLYLAAAAYNGGPGRVSRGLTRFAEEMEGSTGEDRFFALAEHDYLRSETKNYVPQIIAAALVGKDAVRYGFAYDTLAAYGYDSVEVAAGTPLSAVATASGVSVATIRELNPAVLRGMVPPTGSLWLRVPPNGTVATLQIASALAAIPDDERVGYRTWKTAGNESATSIASNAGITSKQLAWYNPGLQSTKKGKLLAGQLVRIPTLSVVAAAANVPDPGIERYGSSTVAATKSGTVHIVKRGESLGRIAARYKLSVARLKMLNGLRSEKLVAGQAIRVRAVTVARTTASRTTASTTASRTTASRTTASRTTASRTTASLTTASRTTASRAASSRAARPTVARKAAVKKASVAGAVTKKATVKKAPVAGAVATKVAVQKVRMKSASVKKASLKKTASKASTIKKKG